LLKRQSPGLELWEWGKELKSKNVLREVFEPILTPKMGV
jgi:hypothetical protein